VRFPESTYMSWAKGLPPARFNLARSGVAPCPPGLLRLRKSDLVLHAPPGYGSRALRQAIGRRYGVGEDQVFTVSGGASLANFVACAAALHGAPADSEVLVEQPTYEPLLRAVEALGHRVLRLPRSEEEGWAVDVRRFESLLGRRTRLAVVTNLHNPTGARISMDALATMAEGLRRRGGFLVVDEVYAECLFGRRTFSAVRAGPNVLATNSLTKAYGLDGLRAGWVLGPAALLRRAGLVHDLLGVNGVAAGEQLALAAFRRLDAVARRSHSLLRGNLALMRRFLKGEKRLVAHRPQGGTIVFARLPHPLDGDAFHRHLAARHSVLVVPGRFFDSPRHVRLSFGCDRRELVRGLALVSRALDEMLT
jgi:aspartate/methionine/tyrosine aminotransferase